MYSGGEVEARLGEGGVSWAGRGGGTGTRSSTAGVTRVSISEILRIGAKIYDTLNRADIK